LISALPPLDENKLKGIAASKFTVEHENRRTRGICRYRENHFRLLVFG